MRSVARGLVSVAVFVMVAAGALSVAAGPITQLTACLKEVPKEPLGEAVYSSWDDDKRRLEIQVAGVANGTYVIFIDGERLEATLMVDANAGALRLDTRWGDTIPLVESGFPICIKLDKVVVLSGKFK